MGVEVCRRVADKLQSELQTGRRTGSVNMADKQSLKRVERPVRCARSGWLVLSLARPSVVAGRDG